MAQKEFQADSVDGGLSTSYPQSRADDGERRRVAWIEAYEAGGWRAAAEATGETDTQVLRWRRMFPQFRAQWQAASDGTATRLEAIVDAIATGEVDATPAQVSMLTFRLRGLRPDVYRERASVAVAVVAGNSSTGEGSRARIMLAEWSASGGA
jgi:hypothetical protein